jgi:hypothetical protein
MALADPRRRRNPVATMLRDAVVLLAVLAIGTTVQVSFERLPVSRDAGPRSATAPQVRPVRPAEVDVDRFTAEPEETVAPAEFWLERPRSAIHADRVEQVESSPGSAIDRGVNVEIPEIAIPRLRLLSTERR